MSPIDRLATVEEKLAFLERAVNELSDVVARQQKELEDLKQTMNDRLARLERMLNDKPGNGGDDVKSPAE